MSGPTDKNARRWVDDRTAEPPQNSRSAAARARAKSSGDVGKALRSVYDVTLSERVPDDFLDLLGKLS